ncbi:hypothetical protein C7402_105285 [Paraburkholderia unamae]|uniref:Transposase n=1 Tax=Paraburkholderia unamae TaxID=219649 RepID=A0ABX5KS03_9BURK|nr:hypothetical protein C7402_105285 [Paraburkholderia unamae]
MIARVDTEARRRRYAIHRVSLAMKRLGVAPVTQDTQTPLG